MRALLLAIVSLQPPAATPVDSIALDAWVAHVGRCAGSPDSLILHAFETHHLVLLGDVHPAAEPKRLVARLVPALKARGRLDVLAVEVPFEQQPVIDAYLRSDPEDIDLLVRHPLTLRAHWGASREYLEIYRAVWNVNHALPADSRIRIVAIDAPGGPPQAASEQEAVARYARRDAVMASRVRRAILGPDPDAHVLLFLGGYHGLKGVEAEVVWNGARARVKWLAARLSEDRVDLFTILTDGVPEPAAAWPNRETLGATRWLALVDARLGAVPSPFAVLVTPLFDAAAPQALLVPAEGPISLRFLPADYALAGAVDAFLYLGRTDPITPLPPLGPSR
jgi:hypothetical protein